MANHVRIVGRQLEQYLPTIVIAVVLIIEQVIIVKLVPNVQLEIMEKCV